MTKYEIYVFLLCLIVFVALTALFTFMITHIVRLTLRIIRGGLEDEQIIKEYAEGRKRAGSAFWTGVDKVFQTLVCLILFGVFALSLYVGFAEDGVPGSVAVPRVVRSASMSEKHEKNTYLTENGLDDQFDTFDIIFTYKLPAESELKLYDVVVYEVDGVMVVHRIVGIEEPNEKHVERQFLLQGDRVEKPDRFPVYYSQMRAIYRGERVRFIGSFVLFMQSPAGWLCILLTVFAIVSIPLVEKKIERERLKRLKALKKTAEAKPRPVQNAGAAVPVSVAAKKHVPAAVMIVPVPVPVPIPVPMFPSPVPAPLPPFPVPAPALVPPPIPLFKNRAPMSAMNAEKTMKCGSAAKSGGGER